MKNQSLLLLALLLPGAAQAAEGFEVGAYGGAVITDPLEVINSSWTAAVRGGMWVNPTLALELDVPYSAGQTRVGTPETFPYSTITPKFGILGRVFVDEPLSMLLGASVGAQLKTVSDDGALGLPVGDKMDADFVASAGPGVMIPFSDALAFRTDVRFLLSMGSENYQNRGDAFLSWETTAGLMLTVGGPKDADKDGIVDEEDSCIDAAEDIDNFEDEDGCPEADNDGDGIVDADDECPNEAEDVDEFEDENGCPEDNNDGDNLVDAEDECPNDAGPKGTMGCPDTDEDGVRDLDDECEDEAGTADAFGCPDGDEDKVPDYRDNCPEEAGWPEANPLRSNGCKGRVYITDKALVITEKIQFATGKADIKPDSHALLDDIFNALDRRKGVALLRISGHTDNQGDAEKNMTLSEERANAVKAYLVEKGTNEKRLKTKGFGDTEPIGDNETAEGREMNRRVEFIIEKADQAKRLKRQAKKQEAAEAAKEAPEGAEAPAEEKTEEKAEEKAEETKEE